MTGTTYMKSWQDFDYVIAGRLPLFLFSGDLLSAQRLPAGRPGDSRVHAAVPGRRAAARPDARRGRPGLLWRAAYLAALGRRAWPRRAAGSASSCWSDPRSLAQVNPAR